jgi:hypothetical protein
VAERPIVAKLAMVVVGLVIALGLAEIGLRLVGVPPTYYYPRDLFVGDPTLGYRLRPGFQGRQTLGEFDVALTVSARGFREEPASVRNDERRILGVGDSMTFGVGVAATETYLAVLEQRLRARSMPVEVVNAGVPGYGTRQELEVFRRERAVLKPELVLVGFYPLNDPHDNVTPYPVERDGFLVSRDAAEAIQTGPLYQAKAFLRTHVHSYAFVVNRLKELGPARRLLVHLGLAGETFPMELQFYCTPMAARVAEAWRTTFAVLDEFAFATKDAGARLAVVVIPARAQVYRTWLPEVQRYCARESATADLDLPIRTLVAHLAARDIPHVDLLARFRELAADGRRLYHEVDGHLNVEGHQVAAASIEAYLAGHNVLAAQRP